MSKIATVIAATALFAGFTASAVAAEQSAPISRAQVLAELVKARASGDLERAQGENGDYSSIELSRGASSKTRADVEREIVRARQAGQLNEAFRESPSDNAAIAGKPVTRQEVRAELNRARLSGELARINSNDSHD